MLNYLIVLQKALLHFIFQEIFFFFYVPLIYPNRNLTNILKSSIDIALKKKKHSHKRHETKNKPYFTSELVEKHNFEQKLCEDDESQIIMENFQSLKMLFKPYWLAKKAKWIFKFLTSSIAIFRRNSTQRGSYFPAIIKIPLCPCLSICIFKNKGGLSRQQGVKDLDPTLSPAAFICSSGIRLELVAYFGSFFAYPLSGGIYTVL